MNHLPDGLELLSRYKGLSSAEVEVLLNAARDRGVHERAVFDAAGHALGAWSVAGARPQLGPVTLRASSPAGVYQSTLALEWLRSTRDDEHPVSVVWSRLSDLVCCANGTLPLGAAMIGGLCRLQGMPGAVSGVNSRLRTPNPNEVSRLADLILEYQFESSAEAICALQPKGLRDLLFGLAWTLGIGWGALGIPELEGRPFALELLGTAAAIVEVEIQGGTAQLQEVGQPHVVIQYTSNAALARAVVGSVPLENAMMRGDQRIVGDATLLLAVSRGMQRAAMA